MTVDQTKDFYIFIGVMCALIAFLIWANEHKEH